jgi:hypothetical protein
MKPFRTDTTNTITRSIQKGAPDLVAGGSEYLLNGSRPGEREAKEDDEEEGTPKVPVPERLAGVLAVGIGEDDELEIADDAC